MRKFQRMQTLLRIEQGSRKENLPQEILKLVQHSEIIDTVIFYIPCTGSIERLTRDKMRGASYFARDYEEHGAGCAKTARDSRGYNRIFPQFIQRADVAFQK